MLSVVPLESELNKLVYPQDLNIVDKIMDKKETFPQFVHKVDNFPKILSKTKKSYPRYERQTNFVSCST